MTLRAGGWREGENLPIGTFVPGEVASRWLLVNKLAMKSNGLVRFYVSPEEANEAGVLHAYEARQRPVHASIAAEDDRRQARIEQLAQARLAKAQKALASAE